MKNKFPLLLILILVISCKGKDARSGDSENDIDAARNFVQSSLNGDFQKARGYMLQDTPNINQMSAIERINLSPEEKQGLAGATINIHNVKKVNDSTTVVIYSNSYKNNWDTLRVKKVQGKWLVDFDYIWTHDQDSLTKLPMLPADTLQKK